MPQQIVQLQCILLAGTLYAPSNMTHLFVLRLCRLQVSLPLQTMCACLQIVILDECSQMVEPLSLLPLMRAKAK